jgi:1,2-diacylglycerol 3-beta-glucosyltransferase
MNELDLLGCAVASLWLLPSAYLGLLTVLSRRMAAPEMGPPRLRFDIIVPAHNEALGIAATVRNLSLVDYPQALRRILVVADNCTDETAAVAREAGALVLERQDAELRGKGYALSFAFEQSLKDQQADAVVVVDADTVVSRNLLRAYAARIEQGAKAAQAHYGVANPEASWRTRLMAIAFGMFHILRSLARERIGVSCGLRGNGMCFTHDLIREIPHDAFSVVEDLEYGIRLGRAGYRVHYVHEAEVLGEMVTSEKSSRSQRQRWEGGRLLIAQQHAWPLLRDGFAKRSALLMDLAMDVLVPPLALIAGPVGLGLMLSLVGSALTQTLWASVWLWGLAAACVALYVLRGWQLSGMGARGLVALAYAPIYVVWKVALLFIPKNARKGEWVRTTREAEVAKTPKP